jgi:hypothetical protein
MKKKTSNKKFKSKKKKNRKLKKKKKLIIKRRKKLKTKKKKYKIKKRIKNKLKQLPIDRIKKIRLPKFKLKKFKLKKVKLKKIKIKKKEIFKIKKKLFDFTNLNFQKTINWLLTPIFRAYDNYFENKKLEKFKKIEFDRKEKERQKKEEDRLVFENKQKELRDEMKFAKEREKDLKMFIRQEQAILRREQTKKRIQFLEQIKLEKKIEGYRKRENLEIQNLEKFALKEKRDDYRPVEERIEKIKEKYRNIRNQKIRERVESLGVEILDTDTKEDILLKEKEYAAQRESIELILESFYRSANSLIFQLNKKYIPKHKSILRVIDRRYESNECFVRYDDSPDDEWLILIYLEDSDAKKGKIVVENKSNMEKHETKIFETKEIFAYSDYLVDAMTSHIDRERQKKNQIKN